MSGANAASEVAFADFARAAGRRFVAPPLILSAALALASIATARALAARLDGAAGVALPPVFERVLHNGFCLTIAALFFAAAIYGVLQLAGAAVDRRRLTQLAPEGPSSPRRSGGALSWVALLSGRPFHPPPEAVWTGAAAGDPRDMADRFGNQRRHYVELGLLPLRFAVWALPILGFIGTVVGVARSIGGLEAVIPAAPGGDPSEGLLTVLGGLRFAFDTTLLGLVAVIPVMVLRMVLGARENGVTEEGARRVLALLAKASPAGADEG